ncbi:MULTISPECIES: LysR family transcriptional regulator [unclassified Mameliella]|uniref:LysR family transcriptional regulator n=1 Tax=Mameliella sp. LZ-28 TaxID=2484146 RepID=UPI00143F7F4C|nr:LysR family transcriptional regulator [Mameliella sp. LZ-28]
MPDRLKTMAILLKVVDNGSITAGAKAMNMPIATVSRRISELEADLGTQLIIRSPRGLVLTDSGAEYVLACRRILDDVAEAERSASGEFTTPRGTLNITAPIVLGRLHVLPVVLDFLAHYPEVDVRLELTDRRTSLSDEHLDLAVRIGPLSNSTLIRRKIGEVRQVICASPTFLDAHGHPSTPDDLRGASWIDSRRLPSSSIWKFDAENHTLLVPIHRRLSVSTAEAALDAAEAGLGFTGVLSYQAAAAVQAGRLELVLRDWEAPPLPVHLIYEPRGLVPKKLRAFIDFAAPRIAKRIMPT